MASSKKIPQLPNFANEEFKSVADIMKGKIITDKVKDNPEEDKLNNIKVFII